MQKKNKPGSAVWTDPDDAPLLTTEMLNNAEVFEGNTFIRRGRGRPSTGKAKEQVSLRLDPDLLARLRATGPGWQSRVNSLLHFALTRHDVSLGQPVRIAEPTTVRVRRSKPPVA